MIRLYRFHVLISIQFLLLTSYLFPANIIPADNPNIQYYGRWDFSDPLSPTHSWPGVYIYAEFEGTSVGISTDDFISYYNVFIDDSLFSIFHGNRSGVTSYTLVSGLANKNHKLLFTLRSETAWTKFSFNGLILDDGKNILTPVQKPIRKIEFVGDSYTVASGNEWTQEGTIPDDSYSNIYKGFASIIARHYDAQYNLSARAGFGLVNDFQGDTTNNVPSLFDRTLVYTPFPKWDFSQWVPDLVVICLGLNDYLAWGGYTGPIPQEKTDLFKKKYHDFISTVSGVYPGAKILAVAANDNAWIKQQTSQVVAEENSAGRSNIYYTYFPLYPGEYVNNGHPNVSAHQKIADTLIASIDLLHIWEPSSISHNYFLPEKISLYQNYPNPFNPVTKIRYAISRQQHAVLKVYDVLGNEISTLVNEEKPAGEYEVEFNGKNFSSGIYYYRLMTGDFAETKEMIILK